jgi:hypothetical protein
VVSKWACSAPKAAAAPVSRLVISVPPQLRLRRDVTSFKRYRVEPISTCARIDWLMTLIASLVLCETEMSHGHLKNVGLARIEL